MINGDFKKMGDMENDMPFTLNFSQYRRKRILDAIMLNDGETREKGKKIMNNFKKQLINKKRQKKIDEGEDPNDISLENIGTGDNGINGRTGFPKLQVLLQNAKTKSVN